jgi:general secretion pathway protein K
MRRASFFAWPLPKQGGAALITAMLLAALITILAASWLARFDSHLRVTEVQRMGTQARWLLRAATDWARMIIREDSANYDDLTEVWAVPIAPIRMTDIAGAQEAYFSGRLMDGQALYNLRNVLPDGTPAQAVTELAWASTLMQSAGLSAVQSKAWLTAIQATPAAAIANARAFDAMPQGVAASTQIRLEGLFIWLPERSLVNINTVQQAVLAAHPNVGDSMAQQMIAKRQQAAIRDVNNLTNALGISQALAQQFDVKTRYFLATGRLAVGRIDVMARSLLQRQNGGPPKLLWSQPL